jgi:hypothetical protein
MRRSLRLSIACVLLVGLTQSVVAQQAGLPRPLFVDLAPLQLTITAPLRTLSRNRRAREEVPGSVMVRDDSGAVAALDVDLRVRGNSRLDVCSYPPLRLDFKRRETAGTVFAGQNRLKLVTLCKDLAQYREFLALEFSIYRAFNALTSSSYRVRWAEIDYIDTDNRRPEPQRRAAFLIEDDTELATRTDMEIWDSEKLDLDEIDPASMALLSVFQFMIGNTDWAGTTAAPGESCCHNGAVFRNHAGLAVVVPYDFDQSGLVDADYARPSADLPIRSVRQRLYRGYCAFNDWLPPAFERIAEARDSLRVALTTAELSMRTVQRVDRYLDDFFAIVDVPASRQQSIVEACRR